MVWLPGAEVRAGDGRAAAGQPDERRQVDRESGGAGPACVDPAVAQSAGGLGSLRPIRTASWSRVTAYCSAMKALSSLAIPLGDLVTAPVPAWCSPGWSFFVEDRACVFLQLDHFLLLLLLGGVFPVLVCAPAPAPLWLGVAAVVGDLLPSDGFSSEVEGRRSHARGAAGGANGSDARARITRREREHTVALHRHRTGWQQMPPLCPAARQSDGSVQRDGSYRTRSGTARHRTSGRGSSRLAGLTDRMQAGRPPGKSRSERDRSG